MYHLRKRDYAVLLHLRIHGGITNPGAFRFLGMTGGNLTKAISNLRKGGHLIETMRDKDTETGRFYAVYVYKGSK